MDNIYKLALDNSADGVLISDSTGRVIYVNDYYEHITGIKKESIMGRNLQDLENEGIFSRSVSLDVIKTGKPHSIIHAYVSGKSALSSAEPILQDGKLIGVVNNTRNIDDLHQLEKKIKDNEASSKMLSLEMSSLKKLLNKEHDFVSVSKQMQETINTANMAAPYDTTVLITGESGTGKEVIARHIHNLSPRRDEAFIRVNCAAIPKELFESELFGYEKGAFTGARDVGKIGLFELANKGTLLLDEIGEMPYEVQSKLLRAIQEKEIRRIGGQESIPIDVRILAATNRNLVNEIEAGNFREDLYFRLSVFPVHIQPLRNRAEDIPAFISYFLERLNKKYSETKTIDNSAFEALKEYSYPGNVRELENIIEYLFILSDTTINIETIPGKVLSDIMINTKDNPDFTEKRNLPQLVDLYEKTIIEDTIRKYKTLESAASVMGIHASTLSRKMKKYNLSF